MRNHNATAASLAEIENHELAVACASIKLLVLNVDGVLTDGKSWQDAKGRMRRTFSVRDAIAIRRWRKVGGKVAVITELQCDQVKEEVERMGADFFIEDCKDKSVALSWILKSEGLSMTSVATFASHGSDLFVAQQGSVIFAAPGSNPEFLRSAHFVTRLEAGDGAVAEACALLLRTRQKVRGQTGRLKSASSDN